MFMLMHEGNDYSILDTSDYSVDICSKEEVKKYLGMGIAIEGLSLINNSIKSRRTSIVRDYQIEGSKYKVFLHSDGLVVIKNSISKLIPIEMRVIFKNPDNIILCKAFHAKGGVIFSVDYQYRKSAHSYEVGRAVYFASTSRRYVNSLVVYPPRTWYERSIPELHVVEDDFYFGNEHLKGYETM